VYKTFYNLRLNPFEITPDPAFLFATPGHNEALASLYYGVRAHKGFVVVTGEVGTGKTLLVRCVLELFKRSDVAFAYVFNPSLSPLEFIRYIAGDFGIPVAGRAKDELILALSSFLVERHQRKLTTLLVVDEAHHLSTEVLEEVRLLTNLETAQQKLLQIILAGQPELDEKLDSFGLRQLKQRVALRCHLQPLSLDDCRGYMQRRLQIAGTPGASSVFSESAVASVHRYSKGIPRLVNTICENALLLGYAKRAATISHECIEEVAHDLRLHIVPVPDKAADGNSSGKEQDKDELLRAVKMLLELHDYLQEIRVSESKAPDPVTHGAQA
jgi:type II secretory pathway predicted ATPase ExeA